MCSVNDLTVPYVTALFKTHDPFANGDGYGDGSGSGSGIDFSSLTNSNLGGTDRSGFLNNNDNANADGNGNSCDGVGFDFGSLSDNFINNNFGLNSLDNGYGGNFVDLGVVNEGSDTGAGGFDAGDASFDNVNAGFDAGDSGVGIEFGGDGGDSYAPDNGFDVPIYNADYADNAGDAGDYFDPNASDGVLGTFTSFVDFLRA